MVRFPDTGQVTLVSAADVSVDLVEQIPLFVCGEVEHYFWCGTIFDHPTPPGALPSHIAHLSSPTHHMWVVYVDEQLAGFAEVDLSADVAVLRRLLLDPDKRSVGAGTAMVRQLVADAAKSGALRVELDVSETNVPAIRCYTKAGFSVVSTTPAPDRPWSRHRMALTVSPAC